MDYVHQLYKVAMRVARVGTDLFHLASNGRSGGFHFSSCMHSVILNFDDMYWIGFRNEYYIGSCGKLA